MTNLIHLQLGPQSPCNLIPRDVAQTLWSTVLGLYPDRSARLDPTVLFTVLFTVSFKLNEFAVISGEAERI